MGPRVLDVMTPWFPTPSNAGSRTHVYGQRAKDAVETARKQFADLIGTKPEEIFFTSGATGSNNIAILGLQQYAERTGRRHIISTAIEHKAVLEPLGRMKQLGFDVDLAPVTRGGYVEPETIRSVRRPDTLLVSVMHANNETGVLQPVHEISELIAAHKHDAPASDLSPSFPGSSLGTHFPEAPLRRAGETERKNHSQSEADLRAPAFPSRSLGTRSQIAPLFHTDAAQTFGKEVDALRTLQCDMMWVSGHKIYGPQGIGALYVRRNGAQTRPVEPLIYRGGQERGLRSGTVPVGAGRGPWRGRSTGRPGMEAATSDGGENSCGTAARPGKCGTSDQRRRQAQPATCAERELSRHRQRSPDAVTKDWNRNKWGTIPSCLAR